MTQQNDPTDLQMNERGAGLLGVIKLVAALAVLTIGGIAIAFVFDVLPRAMLEDLTVKIGFAAAIALAVVGTVALLSRPK
jgi:hypothetical protein